MTGIFQPSPITTGVDGVPRADPDAAAAFVLDWGVVIRGGPDVVNFDAHQFGTGTLAEDRGCRVFELPHGLRRAIV